MRILNYFCLLLISIFAVSSCTNKTVREPAAKKYSYDQHSSDLLRQAAKQGIVFQIGQKAFYDNEILYADEKCNKTLKPTWASQLLNYLSYLNKNPELYKKFHIIDIRRGDSASVIIEKDLDGAQILKIEYSKKEIRKKIELLSEVPCDGDVNSWLEKDITITTYEWPKEDKFISSIKAFEDKQKLERFNFKTDYLVYLADRATILLVDPASVFEKLLSGENFLPLFMNEKAKQVSDSFKYKYTDYWLNEISKHSIQGEDIRFVQLKQDSNLKSGLLLDSEYTVSRKAKGVKNLTSLLISYKINGDTFNVNSLDELELCLRDLYKEYSNLFNFDKKFDLTGDNFMYPGYQCDLKSGN